MKQKFAYGKISIIFIFIHITELLNLISLQISSHASSFFFRSNNKQNALTTVISQIISNFKKYFSFFFPFPSQIQSSNFSLRIFGALRYVSYRCIHM